MNFESVMPRYDSGGFAGIPQRIKNSLAEAGGYDAVVLLLVDGFGWRFFDKFQQEGFLRDMSREGRVEKLTSQFPSTTAAHLTTIHTAQPVGEHAIFEWNFYEPDLDAVITPLLFSFAGTLERDTLKAAGVKPRRFFPRSTFYRDLKNHGISSFIFQHREYTPSSYSDVVFGGATARGYRTLTEALVNLGAALSGAVPPAYFFIYFDRVDAICHEYGPDSPQAVAEIRNLLLTLETTVRPSLAGSGKRTLFMLTADHGQTATDPATTIYINREPRFAGVEKYLRFDRGGKPLVPGGSGRDFFLYIQDGLVDEAQAFLSSRLEGQAQVRKVAELIEAGYFGPRVAPLFRPRAGDLVILPFQNQTVWWYEKDRFEQRFRGHHGGLTPLEMEIPLISCEL